MAFKIDRLALGEAAESWGANFGVIGALLLSTAVPASKWGWVLFLGSNAAWLVFALALRYRKLLLQTCVFTLSSIFGIANTFYPGNAVQEAVRHLLQ